MDSKRILDKLDKIQDDVTEIKVTMAVNATSLEEHMRRTALLEESLKPVEKHVQMVNSILKFIGFVGLILSIIAAVMKILGK